MAWFSKLKSPVPEAPARCARCGNRPGTLLMHVAIDAEAAW